MSLAIAITDVLFWQRLMSAAGLYHGALDGDYGPKTHQAEEDFNHQHDEIAAQFGTFDLRTESVIATLLPVAQIRARQFMKVAGPTVKLLSGTRTFAEQDKLFGQRPKVTNARGGQSNHNFGIAWDVGLFVNGRYLTGATHTEELAYEALAVKVMHAVPHLEWGGDWHSFKDKPHYQLATGKTVDECRRLLEQGKAYA